MIPDVPPTLHRTIGVYATPIGLIGGRQGGGLGDPAYGLDVAVSDDRWPVTLVGSAMFGLYSGSPQAIAYARIAAWRTPGFAAGVVAGGGVGWDSVACPGFCGPSYNYGPITSTSGPLAGLFAEWDWGDRWLRLEPSAFFPSRYSWTPDGVMAATMGPAIVSYGWRLGAHAEVSLRSTVAPLRLAWRF